MQEEEEEEEEEGGRGEEVWILSANERLVHSGARHARRRNNKLHFIIIATPLRAAPIPDPEARFNGHVSPRRG